MEKSRESSKSHIDKAFGNREGKARCDRILKKSIPLGIGQILDQ